MVQPDKISDAQSTVLAHDIAHQIEEEMEYPGQVRVVVIRESRAEEEEDEQPSDGQVKHKELFVLAVATSIDALAVGVTFSMVELSVSIWLAVCLIGCTTFLISLGGVYVGNVFGAKYKNKAEFVGGTILILIGVKIILEHFGVL